MGQYYGFIYVTINLLNNKKYIGKCKFNRKNGWKNYLGSGLYLKRAIKKYGKENFKREILFLALDENELNEIEEFILKYTNAVKSEEYYNIKYTSIGGDTFSNNPNKEKIRLLHSLKNSGENNNMYGVKKSEKMIQSVKDANSIAIIVDDVPYRSISEYAEKFNINNTTVQYRLNSEGFPNYRYSDDSRNKNKRKAIKRIRIEIDGVIYKSVYEASKKLRLYRSTIYKRLMNENYPEYKYVE